MTRSSRESRRHMAFPAAWATRRTRSPETWRQPGAEEGGGTAAVAYNAFFRSPTPDMSKRKAILKQLGDLGLLGHH